jgi:putative transcriptional regulator
VNEKTIREIREEAGLTQQDMADKLGVSRQQYSNYEAHPENVTVKQARSICSILGAAYERVFFGKFGAI